MKTVSELKLVAVAGDGLILDASKRTTSELQSITVALKQKGTSQLILKNCDTKTVFELKSIAVAGNGRVVFDFME